jgi:hypothetical protein
VLLCDLDVDRRRIVFSDDAALVATATTSELCGRAVRIGPAGVVTLA